MMIAREYRVLSFTLSQMNDDYIQYFDTKAEAIDGFNAIIKTGKFNYASLQKKRGGTMMQDATYSEICSEDNILMSRVVNGMVGI